jgi:hypothetical protein
VALRIGFVYVDVVLLGLVPLPGAWHHAGVAKDAMAAQTNKVLCINILGDIVWFAASTQEGEGKRRDRRRYTSIIYKGADGRISCWGTTGSGDVSVRRMFVSIPLVDQAHSMEDRDRTRGLASCGYG